jgi:hypothetical protein
VHPLTTTGYRDLRRDLRRHGLHCRGVSYEELRDAVALAAAREAREARERAIELKLVHDADQVHREAASPLQRLQQLGRQDLYKWAFLLPGDSLDDVATVLAQVAETVDCGVPGPDGGRCRGHCSACLNAIVDQAEAQLEGAAHAVS